MAFEIEKEDGRWAKIPAGQYSEVYRYMLEKGEEDGLVPENAEPCIICREPAVERSVYHTWRLAGPEVGQEAVGTMWVCGDHRGEWTWHPRNPFVVHDGETQQQN